VNGIYHSINGGSKGPQLYPGLSIGFTIKLLNNPTLGFFDKINLTLCKITVHIHDTLKLLMTPTYSSFFKIQIRFIFGKIKNKMK